MSRLTWIGVACTLLAAGLLVGGAGGFTAASAERAVAVAVADDESAILGVDVDRQVPQCKAAVTVENRVGTTLSTVRVEGSHRGNSSRASQTIRDLRPGESATVRIHLDRTADDHAVTITATGEDVSAEVTRDLGPNGCPPRETPPSP